MSAPYLIVWDLDETLGTFTTIADAPGAGQEATVHLRPGIREAIERLMGEDFIHCVLTLAMPAYAEAALRGTGLRELFLDVAGRGQRPKGDASGLAELFGIPKAQMPERMLFIGDHPWLDPPTDPRVVFHLETRALRRPGRSPPSSRWICARRAGAPSPRATERSTPRETRRRGTSPRRRTGSSPWAAACGSWTSRRGPVIAFDDEQAGSEAPHPGETHTFVPSVFFHHAHVV